MSGHSEWANKKHRKEKSDAKKAKYFTKIGREISVAVKLGGSADPNLNTRLAAAIAKAKQYNMPNDNIARSIKNASGMGDKNNYEEVVYECYGPAGSAFVIEALTDNKNRTAGDVRHIFEKSGGSMGTTNCVLFMFDRLGVVVVDSIDVDLNALEEACILIDGVQDFKQEENTFSMTFVEGKRFPYYASLIADKLGIDEDEVINTLSDKEYLQELTREYWFITEDILNEEIYYPLEGYLFASTYEFYNGSNIKEMVAKMLDGMDMVLSNYKDEIEKSEYSIHELLTLASIVEVEGSSSDDRAGVAGVFYNRLKANMSLGSDATTYYAAKIDFSDRDLYLSEINDINAYNTRPAAMAGKLPVGPICSPSEESIKAVINPEEHDYYYFVADKNKDTYFMKTYAEHAKKVAELQASGLWYEYN